MKHEKDDTWAGVTSPGIRDSDGGDVYDGVHDDDGDYDLYDYV